MRPSITYLPHARIDKARWDAGIARADNGVIYGPAHDEKGHASTCARHAHAIATWNAQWQPTGPTIQTAEGDHDADWEAGQ